MRLDRAILNEAKRVLGQKQTTATVEMALRNLINNRKAVEAFRNATGKSPWKGFDDGKEES